MRMYNLNSEQHARPDAQKNYAPVSAANCRNQNQSSREAVMTARDSNGNEFNEGDSVQLIKELKAEGSSLTLKKM